MLRLTLIFCFLCAVTQAATIAIIDTGFDLDHDYLKPKILSKENNEKSIDFQGWDFFDNSHLKKSVIEDKGSLQEILMFRTLRAKGHKQGMSLEEFDWFKKKSSDKSFMEKVRLFKKHSHGTFVASIALREGENIQIFPIRGLNLPNPVVAIEDHSSVSQPPLKGKTAEDKFQDEIRQSIERVSKKFTKIVQFVAQKKIEIINASYGITYKSIVNKFRERYKEFTGNDIEETKLKLLVDDYFRILYERGERTIRRYPHILFIFSAGNSGLDNDQFHHYPSRIKADNTITVAAMNGDYLASFSNYGQIHVDIGAPGVAILSLVPKVYAESTEDLFSPSSGTSMAAPYISNLAAQIKNANTRLTAGEIRKIILQTATVKDYLKTKLLSGAVANNDRALKAALLSKDLPLTEAINLGNSDLIPMEDKISIGLAPAVNPEDVKKKVMDSVPGLITPLEVDDEPELLVPTKPLSSAPKDQGKVQPDTSTPPVSTLPDAPSKSADLTPSNQSGEQSPGLSGE
jgi:subtilisin family serine protease